MDFLFSRLPPPPPYTKKKNNIHEIINKYFLFFFKRCRGSGDAECHHETEHCMHRKMHEEQHPRGCAWLPFFFSIDKFGFFFHFTTNRKTVGMVNWKNTPFLEKSYWPALILWVIIFFFCCCTTLHKKWKSLFFFFWGVPFFFFERFASIKVNTARFFL